MSHVQHQSISVTSWNAKKLNKCRERLFALSLIVTEIYKSEINGFSTFFIVPCGSNAGWDEARYHLKLIEEAKVILKSYEYEDGSSVIEYCVSIYGESEG